MLQWVLIFKLNLLFIFIGNKYPPLKYVFFVAGMYSMPNYAFILNLSSDFFLWEAYESRRYEENKKLTVSGSYNSSWFSYN